MFASAFVATKYTVGSVPPLLVCALRFTAAAVVLSAFLATQVRARRSGLEPIRPSDRLRVVILGLLGIFACITHCFFGHCSLRRRRCPR